MRHTVTSLFLLLLLSPAVSALIFSFDSPSQALINESFSVSISASTTNTYDVKIFVHDQNKKIISQIYNDGWKNPYYYVKSVFPEKSEFDIRITSYTSEATLCVRMRKSGSSSFTEECDSIEIDEQKQEEPDEEEKEPEKNITKPESNPDFISTNQESAQLPEQQTEQEAEKPERIHLNPQARESSDKFITKDQKIRLFALYSFTALVILIVIFLAFKKL